MDKYLTLILKNMDAILTLIKDNAAPIAIIVSIISLLYAVYLIISVLKRDPGDEKMREIARAIQEGANAYLNRQTITIAVFTVIIFIVINFIPSAGNQSLLTAIGFLVGAIFSALAGYIGMSVSVRANVRTAQAAKNSLQDALSVAFKGGSVTGLAVVGLSLLGVSGFYLIFTQVLNIPVDKAPQILIGFGFGASLVSLFARVGGGIFTKAADVGADLVGKIEQNIPEDDPRNPAVIADNVGDNVGDCAGMGADLFETYAVTLIAAMILASTTLTTELGSRGIEYPLMLGAIAVIASIIGTFFIKLGRSRKIMRALYKGMIVTGVLSAIGFYFATMLFIGNINIFYAALVGLGITLFITIITEYYTSTEYNPVKKIAKASQTGAGTNIITGLAVGLESTMLPVILIVVGIFLSYTFGDMSGYGGIYGIAIAAVAMLSTTGMVIATDSYGPITDNAGGIAEMANLPEEVRKNTDALDAVGNTTKAVTKGYAISSAALAALVLFQSYKEELFAHAPQAALSFDLTDYRIIMGLLLGALLPFLFSASCMESVGKTAYKVVEEVRYQFKTKKGIMDGSQKPDYGRCVDIVTKSALKEMIFPALLAVLSPIIVGFLPGLGPIALGGMLVGVIISGFLLALQMCTGGGAWDNAKKYIEDGHFGGKGSDAHKAAVVGDTVGDPFKDTAGPAINSLIKVINTISLIIATTLGASLLN